MFIDPLTFAAIIPALILLGYIYHLDPVEKEPAGLLLSLLFVGMLSTIPAIILEFLGESTFGGIALRISSNVTLNATAVQTFLIVALVEESCKYIFLRSRTWENPNFDYVFDGIVYAAFVGLGFAIAENIGYVWSFGLGTAFARAFTAIPGHCTFAIFMGYFYGIARRNASHGHTITAAGATVLALLVPMFLHGLYDYLATTEDARFFIFLVVFVAFGMLIAKHVAKKAQRV